ncbi:MAG: GspE/PulE family protein [Candidatus Eremiobacteraeota bacterium]|nr:GspE/PulE family protein [Candidatus Eremiobacteraeota bacterium]
MALSAGLRDAILEDEFSYPSSEAVACIPPAFAAAFDVLPFRLFEGELHVIVTNQDDESLLNRIRAVSGMRVRASSATREWIRSCLKIAYSDEAIEPAGTFQRGDAPPAIRAIDDLHDAAVSSGASDIHIEPTGDGGRVRYRIDGMLHEVRRLPAPMLAQIVSRVKLLAGMDIADKRQPQDGRYHVDAAGKSIDARVSSMPTIGGEKVVIRLLDMHASIPTLERLGIAPDMLERYRARIHAPHGFVVVCGPTGSGKTTTLYASLNERNVEGQHICTVEDPVEARLPGVAQVQVHPRAGLTFASALRSFLRQDPNVIMVGEMRDSETASVAISAALSGQLVVASIHASDAPRTVDRLVELGLKRHAIAAGLSGVVAQRLVRELCEHCRLPVTIAAADAEDLRLGRSASVYEARGCERCNGSGYRGRIGIFEFLAVTNGVRAAIATGESSVSLAEMAAADGYEPMVSDGIRCVLHGRTSIEELRRVLSIGAVS